MADKIVSSILIVGNWRWEIYEAAFAAGFTANQWSVNRFDTSEYFSDSFPNKVQRQLRYGPTIGEMNTALVRNFSERPADSVLFIRSDLIYPGTLRRLKKIKRDVVLLLYHNDNPFVGLLNKIKMRNYLRSLKFADVALVYRPANIADAYRYDAPRVELLMPNYLSYCHKPSGRSTNPKHDVVFIGHYCRERAKILDFLCAHGINLMVFGGLWQGIPEKYKWIAGMKIYAVLGDDYTGIINSSKIALVFLSKKNKDVYTRRCFEIPACGAMMLAPRTRELQGLFEEGREAVYYDSKEDLLDKVRYYLSHDDERVSIARAGRERCLRDGHDESARAGQLIRIIEEIRSANSIL